VTAVTSNGKKWYYAAHYPIHHRTGRVDVEGRWCPRSLTRLPPDTEYSLLVLRGLTIATDDLVDDVATPVPTSNPGQAESGPHT
jgi:hypothetical protein